MRRILALVTAMVFAAQIAPAETPPATPSDANAPGGGRGARFWTGVGLLAGGLGLTAFAAARAHDCGSMMSGGCGAMMGDQAAMNVMMQGMHPEMPVTAPPMPVPQGATSHHSSDHDLNAVAIGVGVAAATAGLVLVLSRGKDRTRGRSLGLRPGIGQVTVVMSF